MMIILILIVCLFVASFFAGMETGLLAADKLKIYSQKEHGKPGAKAADFLLMKPERLLGTTLVGTNIAVVTSAVVLANYLRNQYSGTVAVIGGLVLTIIFLFFSEIIPKTFFRRYADSVAVHLAGGLLLFYYAFLPLSFVLNLLVKMLLILLRQKKQSDKLPRSREDFRLLLHLSGRESGLEFEDYRTIDDILDFRMTLASEAMIPLHTYPVFHVHTRPIEVIKTARKTHQRFFPCYEDRTDNIVGYVDVEDFIRFQIGSIGDLLHEPIFFPEVKPLPDLLNAMIERGLQIVFLCDEYGGISGLLTHLQIYSEIIGNIPGYEHPAREDVMARGDKKYTAAGNTDLEYFSHVVGIKIKKGNNETLGGYLCEKMGIVPSVGTTFREGSLKFTILEGDKLAVRSIRVELLAHEDGPSG